MNKSKSSAARERFLVQKCLVQKKTLPPQWKRRSFSLRMLVEMTLFCCREDLSRDGLVIQPHNYFVMYLGAHLLAEFGCKGILRDCLCHHHVWLVVV
jgi:hypothetical protein